MAARLRRWRVAGALAALLLSLAAAPAAAQTIVTSARPDSVDVTVYRNPERSQQEAINRRWLGGCALITETRRISVPAGQSDIRFEGVAAGILPQSAIVTGFPEGVVERNQDAYLLSPGTLVARSLGRRVTLRRTSLATGAVREMEAVIRTGTQGAVVLETPDGFESLRCTGLSETLVYGGVPAGLSSKPTLSVRVRAAQPVTATVTLAYLADGFDWQANYVAMLSEDGTRASLFAWLTLASNDETSFPDADAQAVAGTLNRERAQRQPAEGPPLQLRCWPHATTSDIPLEELMRGPPPPPAPVMVPMPAESIVVTGSRTQRGLLAATPLTVMQAEQEALGAVKLYRIPEPVTIAANSQKQVALLQLPEVTIGIVHRARILLDDPSVEPRAAARVLVTRNRTEEGLGLPLPSGPLVLLAPGPDRPIVLGEGNVRDLALAEDVEVRSGRRRA